MNLVLIVGESGADKFIGDSPVIKAERAAEVNCPFAAVIVGKNAEISVRDALGVIVDGEGFNKEIPRGIQLVTCGISPKNTVCVTSRTAEKLTLALNRTIRTKTGTCEPLEMPVDLPENACEYDLMAAFAAKLLNN